MPYKEHDINRNAWSKIAENIGYHTKWYITVDTKNLLCIYSGKESKT